MSGALFTIPAGTFGAAAIPVTIGDVALAASTIMGTAGLIQQGQAQKAAGKYQQQVAVYQGQLANAQAAAQEQQAGQERAVSQRAAMEQRRQGRIVGSRAQALASASGAGALDPTLVDITAGIDTEAELRALTALYQGEERARGLEYGATVTRAGGAGTVYAGEAARRAGEAAAGRSYLAAGGTLLSGAGTMADRYRRRSLLEKYGMLGDFEPQGALG